MVEQHEELSGEEGKETPSSEKNAMKRVGQASLFVALGAVALSRVGTDAGSEQSLAQPAVAEQLQAGDELGESFPNRNQLDVQAYAYFQLGAELEMSAYQGSVQNFLEVLSESAGVLFEPAPRPVDPKEAQLDLKAEFELPKTKQTFSALLDSITAQLSMSQKLDLRWQVSPLGKLQLATKRQLDRQLESETYQFDFSRETDFDGAQELDLESLRELEQRRVRRLQAEGLNVVQATDPLEMIRGNIEPETWAKNSAENSRIRIRPLSGPFEGYVVVRAPEYLHRQLRKQVKIAREDDPREPTVLDFSE